MGRQAATRMWVVATAMMLFAAVTVGAAGPSQAGGTETNLDEQRPPIAAARHGSDEFVITSPPPIQIDLATPGPLGAVSVIGDSVLHGSGRYSPTLPTRLAEQGWGPIRFRAGAGYSSGYFGRSFELTATHWIDRWRAEGWDAPNVIVNIGANDTEFCGTDVECSYRAVTHLVDHIGPGHRIWWPKITKFYTHSAQADAWNAALDRLASERVDVFTWDWPTELATGGYESNDNTHLRPASYPLRSLRMAENFTSQFTRAQPVGGRVDLAVPLGSPSTFVGLEPVRLVDTRDDPSLRQTTATTLRVQLAEDVPDGTTAVALYVAAVAPSGRGFLTAGPCSPTGGSATVTFAGSTIGAPTIVAVTGDGSPPSICVDVGGLPGTSSDVVVDLVGAFIDRPDGLRLHPLDVPTRVADTRSSQPTSSLVLAAPTGADAVVLNLAVANAQGRGYLTATGCDATTPDSPTAPTAATAPTATTAPTAAATTAPTANLNFGPGPAASASAIVAVGDDGTVCITSSIPADIIVDMTATLDPPPDEATEADGLAFVPIEPLRVLDTRDGTGGWAPFHGAGQTLDIAGGPPWADAVTGTLTIVGPDGSNFLQASDCATSPTVASGNAPPGTNIANSLTTGLGTGGRLCLRSHARAQTVLDVTGWWADAELAF